MSKYEPIHLSVRGASRTSAIELSDARFQVLVRDVGGLEAVVAPGVYSLRFSDVGTTELVDIVVRPGNRHIVVDAPHFRFATSVPLDLTSTTHEWHAYAAEDASAATPISHGVGGRLFVFAREVAPYHRTNPSVRGRDIDLELALSDPDSRRHYAAWSTDWAPTNPAGGLTLLTPEGKHLVDFGREGDHADDAHRAGCSIDLDPGWYRLRVETEGAPRFLEMPVVVTPGWQTNVFLRANSLEGLVRPDLASAMVSVSPYGRFSHVHPGGHLEARIQEALRTTRPVSGVLDVIAEHKSWLAEMPMLGICAGYLALRSLEPPRRRVLDLTEMLLCLLGSHPDVVALRLAADANARLGPIAIPPMLAASWRAIVRASYSGGELVPAYSWIDRIASSAAAASPWIVWSEMDSPGGVSAPPATVRMVQDLLEIAPLRGALRADGMSPMARRIATTLAPIADTATRDLMREFDLESQALPWTEERLGLHVFVPRCTLLRGLAELRDAFLLPSVAESPDIQIVESTLRRIAEERSDDAVILAEQFAQGAGPRGWRVHCALVAAEMSLTRLEDPDRAEYWYRRALHEDPEAVIAVDRFGEIYQRSDDHWRMAQLLVRFADAAKGSPRRHAELLGRAARLYDEVGLPNRAKPLYEKAAAADPDCWAHRWALADHLAAHGRWIELAWFLETQRNVASGTADEGEWRARLGVAIREMARLLGREPIRDDPEGVDNMPGAERGEGGSSRGDPG